MTGLSGAGVVGGTAVVGAARDAGRKKRGESVARRSGRDDPQADGGRPTVLLVVDDGVGDPEAVTLPTRVRETVGVDFGDPLRVIADVVAALFGRRRQYSV